MDRAGRPCMAAVIPTRGTKNAPDIMADTRVTSVLRVNIQYPQMPRFQRPVMGGWYQTSTYVCNDT